MGSIVIRTHNEEKWINLCLNAVFSQTYKDIEVIIVDNESTDMTLAKAKNFNVKIINIEEFLPGKALNLGISESKGRFIACLSAHCIPVNDHWLSNLVKNFDDEKVAGVYGKQEPLSYTSDLDKRDLLNIFGLDKKIQKKDSFFHNANSMIRRDVWEKFPFDEEVTNIEDRVWAKEVLASGYKIVYEPDASVYHYHGIYQENDIDRCRNTVKIIETLKLEDKKKPTFDIQKLNVAALIPVKGEVQYLNDAPLIKYTIQRCKQSELIKDIVVSTDNTEIAEIAKGLGAKVPFLRTKELSQEYVELEKVLQFSLQEMEKNKIIPDIVAILEVTHPFRPKNLLDNMITQLVSEGLDSMIAAKPEHNSCWINDNNEFKRIDEGFIPRELKQPFYIGLVGLGCITYPAFIRKGQRFGGEVGIVEISDPFSLIEVRDEMQFALANKVIDFWWKKNS